MGYVTCHTAISLCTEAEALLWITTQGEGSLVNKR